jgi:hypothetical protein
MHTLNIHQSNINIKNYTDGKAFLQTSASRKRMIKACYVLFPSGWGAAQEIGPKIKNSLNIFVVKQPSDEQHTYCAINI